MNLKTLVKKLKTFSDYTRFKILLMLSVRPCCVCELSQFLNLSQPTLTKHLQKLQEAGLVDVQKFKNYQIYKLSFENKETETLYKTIISVLSKLDEETKSLLDLVKNTLPVYQIFDKARGG